MFRILKCYLSSHLWQKHKWIKLYQSSFQHLHQKVRWGAFRRLTHCSIIIVVIPTGLPISERTNLSLFYLFIYIHYEICKYALHLHSDYLNLCMKISVETVKQIYISYESETTSLVISAPPRWTGPVTSPVTSPRSCSAFARASADSGHSWLARSLTGQWPHALMCRDIYTQWSGGVICWRICREKQDLLGPNHLLRLPGFWQQLLEDLGTTSWAATPGTRAEHLPGARRPAGGWCPPGAGSGRRRGERLSTGSWLSIIYNFIARL